MKDERLYLIHIAECFERIVQYTENGRDEFLTDIKTQDAVIRNFEIIGEAVKRISDDTRNLAPEMPWRQLAGFRDVLIHQYDGIDPMEVWQTVEKELPVFQPIIARLLQEMDKTNGGKN